MKHWTDGLSNAAIRKELAVRAEDDAARALVDETWQLLAEIRAEIDEWFPGSLKRVDEYIAPEQTWP